MFTSCAQLFFTILVNDEGSHFERRLRSSSEPADADSDTRSTGAYCFQVNSDLGDNEYTQISRLLLRAPHYSVYTPSVAASCIITIHMQECV